MAVIVVNEQPLDAVGTEHGIAFVLGIDKLKQVVHPLVFPAAAGREQQKHKNNMK